MWSKVPLGDVAVVSWGDTSTTKAAYTPDGFPAFSASGLDGLLPHADHSEQGVVLSAIGAQCGKTWLTPSEWSCIKNTMWFRARDDCAVTPFLYYATADPAMWPRRGAAQPFVSLRDAREMEVFLPPLAIQRKIVAILSAYDDLIENNNRRIKLLEEMAQRIYREWFVEFRYPGHEAVPLLDSELGPIPKGWPVARLSELTTTQYGYTESAVSDPVGPHFLRGMDINKTSFVDWATVPYCPIDDSDHAKYHLEPGDVVIIRMADPGKVGIVETEIDAVFASYLIRVRPRDASLAPYFLFYLLASARYQDFVSGASTGTTRKSLSAPLITSFAIARPPAAVQAAFVDAVAPLRRLLNTLVLTNAALRSARDVLLPRLISGEIEVTDLDIAVPNMAA